MKSLLKVSKGFTLIELMVVMTIMSVLAAIVVPQVTGTVTSGKSTVKKNDLQAVQSAVDRYNADHSSSYYPVDTNGAAAPSSTAYEVKLSVGGADVYLKDIVWDAALSATSGAKKLVPDYLKSKPSRNGDVIEDTTTSIKIEDTTYTVAFKAGVTSMGIWAVDGNGKVWLLLDDGTPY